MNKVHRVLEMTYLKILICKHFPQEQRRKRTEKSVYVVVMTSRVEGASSLTGEKGPKVAISIILIFRCASISRIYPTDSVIHS